MKMQIDASIFCGDGLTGRIYGDLQFYFVPTIGMTVDLSYPNNGITAPRIRGIIWQFNITNVLVFPGAHEKPPLLMLSDIEVDTMSEGRQCVAYLEAGFGLSCDWHDSDGDDM